MKYSFLYLFTFLFISLVSCSDDDSGSCTDNIDNLSVRVDDVAMSRPSGSASVSTDEISVDINGNSSNNSSIFFSCPNIVGVYDLNLDFSGGSDSQTITAFVPEDNFNIILSSGCFEIVSIDDSEVVMRFDVSEDNTELKGEINLDVL